MSISRVQILGLYRRLLRQGSQFQAYNYRHYTLRRVRDYFKEKKSLTNPQQIEQEYQYGLQTLAMLGRQQAKEGKGLAKHARTTLSEMYHAPKLVVEPEKSS